MKYTNLLVCEFLAKVQCVVVVVVVFLTSGTPFPILPTYNDLCVCLVAVMRTANVGVKQTQCKTKKKKRERAECVVVVCDCVHSVIVYTAHTDFRVGCVLNVQKNMLHRIYTYNNNGADVFSL